MVTSRVDGVKAPQHFKTPRARLQELAAHRLDLLLDHGPHVISEHDGAHVLRRLDGREARHARSEHQDAGGCELACAKRARNRKQNHPLPSFLETSRIEVKAPTWDAEIAQ